jgi:hypothetical protein
MRLMRMQAHEPGAAPSSIGRQPVLKAFLISPSLGGASTEAMEANMNGFLIPTVMLVMVIGAAIYIARTGRNVNS